MPPIGETEEKFRDGKIVSEVALCHWMCQQIGEKMARNITAQLLHLHRSVSRAVDLNRKCTSRAVSVRPSNA